MLLAHLGDEAGARRDARRGARARRARRLDARADVRRRSRARPARALARPAGGGAPSRAAGARSVRRRRNRGARRCASSFPGPRRGGDRRRRARGGGGSCSTGSRSGQCGSTASGRSPARRAAAACSRRRAATRPAPSRRSSARSREHARVQYRRFDLARTLLAQGETLRRFKRKRAAREAIEAAIAIFDELGAALWSAKARRELARISGRRTAEGLTETERRVAELVAAGRSNKQVASDAPRDGADGRGEPDEGSTRSSACARAPSSRTASPRSRRRSKHVGFPQFPRGPPRPITSVGQSTGGGDEEVIRSSWCVRSTPNEAIRARLDPGVVGEAPGRYRCWSGSWSRSAPRSPAPRRSGRSRCSARV